MRRLLLSLVCTLALFGLQPVVAQASPVATRHVVDEGDTFVPMAPRRVLDTRSGTGPLGLGYMYLDLAGRVPAEATAVVLNLTGTEPSTTTYVGVAPAGSGSVAHVSNLNLTAGETRANLVTVALSPTDRRIVLNNNAGHVHLIADLAGYYTPVGESRFTPTSPARVLDTRTSAPVGPGGSVEVDLSGRVPASATSATFNLTGTGPTATTFVTAHPSGATRPTASNLNLVAGQTSPNLVTVTLGTNRRVTLYNNAGSVHLVVDLAGYYATDRGHRFFPMPPTRAADTRDSGGPVGPQGTRDVDLASRIAPTAAAAVLNLTGAAPTANTFVTAYPAGTPRPLASNLNLTPQRDTANSAVVALGQDARMTLYNDAGATDLAVDLAGFFATPPQCVGDCVYGWGGYRGYGATPAVRPWLSGVVSVAAGNLAAYAVRSDGTVWAWGNEFLAALGTGAPGARSMVPLRVAGLTGVTAVAAGSWAGYALRSDGTVWAWGMGWDGLLGNGDTAGSDVPVQVYGLTGVTAIAASRGSAYALRSDGTVWGWGVSEWGDGGCPTGQVCPLHTPVRVALPLPGSTRITAIAAGQDTAYALRSDGTVWAWGRDTRGGTGTGAPPQTSVNPTQVVGLTDVVSIAGGDQVGYAVRADGTVWAWGDDYWGTLGTGAPCDHPEIGCQSNVPVQVPGLTGPVVIKSGGGTTFAVKPDGTVWAWGRNDEAGNLGNGTSQACYMFPLPAGCRVSTPVRTLLTGVSGIAAGGLGHFAVVPGAPRG